MMTEEGRKKVSESMRLFRLGRKWSPEMRKKLSEAHKGLPSSLKGKKLSSEHKKKLSEAHMGQAAWNKGLKGCYSEETLLKMSVNHRGSKASKWKGGVTPLLQLIRNLPKYKEWKIAIFKKYNNICQKCGLRSSCNHSHHKRPFAEIAQIFLNKYNQFSPIKNKEILINLAISYKSFWEIDNGTVLCRSCHGTITRRLQINADVD